MSPKMKSKSWVSSMALLQGLQALLVLIRIQENLWLNLPCKLAILIKRCPSDLGASKSTMQGIEIQTETDLDLDPGLDPGVKDL